MIRHKIFELLVFYYENILKNNHLRILGNKKKDREDVRKYYFNQFNHIVYNIILCCKYFPKTKKKFSFADIGFYPGTLVYVLRKIFYEKGFNFFAFEHFEILRNQRLKSFFKTNLINLRGMNLNLDQEIYNKKFDLVLFSETLEHLRINPYFVLKNISKIVKKKGRLILTVPNNLKLSNRLRALFGKSVLENVKNYIVKNNDNTNLYGYHWREYTLSEIEYLLVNVGFKIEKIKTVSYNNNYFFNFLSLCGLNIGQKIVAVAKKN